MTDHPTAHELVKVADGLSVSIAAFQTPGVTTPLDQLEDAALKAQAAWSGSPFGYHSRVYYKSFSPAPAGAVFSIEWGFESAFSNPTRGDWVEFAYADAIAAIKQLAGNPDLSEAEAVADDIRAQFEDARDEVISLLTAFLAEKQDPVIADSLEQAKVISPLTYDQASQGFLPRGTLMSRDYAAVGQGVQVAPHQAILARVVSLRDAATSSTDLEKLARRAAAHISRLTSQAVSGDAQPPGDRVFIGHGRSALWRELKDFVQDRLQLPWDEFNRVPVAGVTNIARLAEVLEHAGIAFLVLTAEDEQSDGTFHARQNVIHEAGLFQGRLGFSRAIVLLEEGCDEFTNIQGLGQIRFPKGNIAACFEEIRRVLERENFIAETV